MEPELVPKSMENGFQEAFNKKDEKCNQQKSCKDAQGCARVRGGARARGGGVPYIKIHPEGPEGPVWALGHSTSCPRKHGGGLNALPVLAFTGYMLLDWKQWLHSLVAHKVLADFCLSFLGS